MKFDIAILGNGIIANLLALILSRKYKVCLISNQTNINTISKKKPQWIALTPDNYLSLCKFGFEDFFTFTKSCNIERMQVWHTNSSGSFDIENPNVPFLFKTINLHDLTQFLHDYNLTNLKLEIFTQKLELDAIDKNLRLTNNIEVDANFTVLADRSYLDLATKNKFKFFDYDYQQTALTYVIKTNKPHQKVSKQWFYENYIIGLLPLHEENSYCVVLSVDNLLLRNKMFLQENILSTLQNITDNRVGDIQEVNFLGEFPLSFKHAKKYVIGNTCLVGDIAHSLHPLAGQGLNLSLRDVFSFVKHVDPSNSNSLRKYYRDRLINNWQMSAITHTGATFVKKPKIFNPFMKFIDLTNNSLISSKIISLATCLEC